MPAKGRKMPPTEPGSGPLSGGGGTGGRPARRVAPDSRCRRTADIVRPTSAACAASTAPSPSDNIIKAFSSSSKKLPKRNVSKVRSRHRHRQLPWEEDTRGCQLARK